MGDGMPVRDSKKSKCQSFKSLTREATSYVTNQAHPWLKYAIMMLWLKEMHLKYVCPNDIPRTYSLLLLISCELVGRRDLASRGIFIGLSLGK